MPLVALAPLRCISLYGTLNPPGVHSIYFRLGQLQVACVWQQLNLVLVEFSSLLFTVGPPRPAQILNYVVGSGANSVCLAVTELRV